MAKSLTSEEIKALCNELEANDYRYARSLDALQSVFLRSKPHIKSWQDFKTVEELKRVIIGLHGTTKSFSLKDGDRVLEIQWQD